MCTGVHIDMCKRMSAHMPAHMSTRIAVRMPTHITNHGVCKHIHMHTQSIVEFQLRLGIQGNQQWAKVP